MTGFGVQRHTTRNDSADDFFEGAFVPQLAAAQAVANPQRMALVAGDDALSYLELDRRANQVAHYLRSLNVRPETLVGVCLGRSPAMIVSALGILKAGCAYLPLDPAYPSDRLSFMFEDSGSSLLLTKERLAERFKIGKSQLLDVDKLQFANYSEISVEQPVRGDHLAYVIYTSGSTGLPKGVEITHASLLNLVLWHQQTFGIESDDRASQLASPAFDAAVWEVWPYLAVGASIHIPADSIRNEPLALRDWLVMHRITISFVPTPLAERMLRLPWPQNIALRVLLTGADTLHTYPPPGLPFTLVNNYGPTECTVVASSGAIASNECPEGLPSIGRPITNTQIYIFDEELRPVPTGMPGEIWIGGAGVARGYVNHPELSADKFISNPLSSHPNDRIYRTGDLGRYLPDGQIEFLGRGDDQIKVRGYRIEPNEIITVLNQHPSVEASHVIASADRSDRQLVGYLILRSGSTISYKPLREFLGKFLPDYMVPSIFVLVDSFPVTPNGKIDRDKLPKPDLNNVLQDNVLTLPETSLEPQVGAILASLLKLNQVARNANFFLLGGHSLLGIQVISRIKEAFGVEIPLYRLFEGPTVAELAAEIDRLLLAKIQAMSEDEAERLLAADAAGGLEKL